MSEPSGSISRKSLQGLGLRWKLMLTMGAFILILLLSILFGISRSVENHIRQEIHTNFTEAGQVFDRIQEIRFRQLSQTAILLADAPRLKAAVSTGDTTTINQNIREDLFPLLDFDPMLPDSLVTEEMWLDTQKSGMLMVTDRHGTPIGQLSERGLPEYSMAHYAGVADALRGGLPDDFYIRREDDRYFSVTTVPVFTDIGLIGTLSYGFPIRPEEAMSLAEDIGNEVFYFVDNRILSASLQDLEPDARKELSQAIYAATLDLEDTEDRASVTFDMQFLGEQWLFYVSPMQQHTEELQHPGYYVVAQSLTRELAPQRELQSIIFGIGVIGLIAAMVFGILLTTHITKPINKLIEGIRRIEEGDYSKPVPVTRSDEMGYLTQTFNNLVENLRERLQMLKFVSRATQDAIKANLTEIPLGGKRKEVVVLFSDIRNFTQWSESRPPEEVISMLNSILRYQAEIIQKHGGDIDKFVGDELVAVFEGSQKEQNAVLASMEIQHNQHDISKQDEISTGIGINSGEVLMGAMGSQERMDYTVLGHNVNLAARLCSSAGPGQILITESVYLALQRSIETKSLKPVSVKGVEEPVQVYEVIYESYHSQVK